MSAYVISEVRACDPELVQRYRMLAAASIARHGGRYLVRGAHPLAAEGAWDDGKEAVVVEFPSMAALREWYGSSDYAEALTVGRDALERRLLFMEGVADTSTGTDSAEPMTQ